MVLSSFRGTDAASVLTAFTDLKVIFSPEALPISKRIPLRGVLNKPVPDRSIKYV